VRQVRFYDTRIVRKEASVFYKVSGDAPNKDSFVIVKLRLVYPLTITRLDLTFRDICQQLFNKGNVLCFPSPTQRTASRVCNHRVESALKAARVVVVLLSEASLNSKWVRRELEFADDHDIPVVRVHCGAASAQRERAVRSSEVVDCSSCQVGKY
jgi:hypothetical protein